MNIVKHSYGDSYTNIFMNLVIGDTIYLDIVKLDTADIEYLYKSKSIMSPQSDLFIERLLGRKRLGIK